jgi:hypothetical protein
MLGSDSTVVKQSQSSLPLQVLIFFNWHFMTFFFLLNLALFTYKSINFYYPTDYLGWDITIAFLYAIVESCRLLLVSKANKTSQMDGMFWSLVLGCPIIVAHAYLIALQTYVLRVDLVINSIAFVVVGIEMIVGFIAYSQFFMASRRF